MIDTNIENELDSIVYGKVKRGEYPPVPIAVQYENLAKQLNDLKKSKIPRPKTKVEYFALLESLEKQISDIKKQNESAMLEYSESKKQIDYKYSSDIELAKLDQANIGMALCKCIDYHLNDTLWCVAKDSCLSVTSQSGIDKWRKDMMNIPTTAATVTEAIATFNTLVATKPDYKIKWKK